MDGVQAVEGELNAVVKEYLQMLEYTKSAGAFDKETNGKGKQILVDALPPSQDENQMHIQKKILQAFDNGNNQVFTRLWTENIPEQLQEDSSCKRLEFNIQLYFAIFAIKQDALDQHKIDRGMKAFKTFLETRGAVLSQTTEFVTFYALPFVPASSLKNHPSFSILFEDSWTSDLRQKLTDFLSTVLYAASLPYLYKLFTGSGDRSRTEKMQYENHIQALQQQISEHEYRATLYFKRYTRIQADYKNLINIAAELVDSLESAVRGKMVTPEYLRSICERLFSSSQNPVQSTDFTRPGTAASLLRASVANTKTGLAIGNDVPYLPSLNYAKIKDDLRRLSPRKQALLVQALRLRLTKSQVGEQRDTVISGYIANDVLGCSSDIKQGETIVNLLLSKDDLVECQTAMLFNAVASFTTGRVYIGQSEVMMKELITCLKSVSEKTKTGENLLGAMQKLSLRRQVQSIMIDCGLVLWLLKLLEEPENLNDYSLEYSVALLMNLCLRSEGKKQCIQDCEGVLQLLADLLGHENREIRPYVNGTLYSILALPTIRQRAVSMGLEEVLRCYVQEDDPDMNRQIKFIIKQMNANDKYSNDDPQSDNEDEEDDDEEGDVLDAELDEEEAEIAKSGELYGEQLLSAKYLGVLSSLSMSTAVDTKALGISSVLDEEKPFTRPVTPRAHQKLSAIEEMHSRGSVRSDLGSRSGRPKTQSSGNAARRNEREPSNSEMPPPRSQQSSRQGRGKLDPFQTKPRIPRTPDSLGSNRSRPVTGDMPLPTRSVSPPVPKPSSRGQDCVKCFYDCLEPCRSMKKRHFHCKICNYVSDRLDNMKRHIPYHFLKLKKERQRAPDGMKMVCHEYFTEVCNVDDCSYSQKSYSHFHCTLCKSWACNIKKSYEYRLKHLNRSHCMFFTDKENPCELPNDRSTPKKTKKLQESGEAKLFRFPAAVVEVLNSRRRAKNSLTKNKKPPPQWPDIGFPDSEADITYFDRVGQFVKNVVQPIEDGADQSKGKVDAAGTSSSEVPINKSSSNDVQTGDSTYSVTLNGDLGTILTVLMSVKKSGIVLEDPSLREIISSNPGCSANELMNNISQKDNNNITFETTCDNILSEEREIINSTTDSSSLSDEGFSETAALTDLSGSFVEEWITPANGVSNAKGFTLETDKILEFLSKMVNGASAVGQEPPYNQEIEGATIAENEGPIVVDQVCSTNYSENESFGEGALTHKAGSETRMQLRSDSRCKPRGRSISNKSPKKCIRGIRSRNFTASKRRTRKDSSEPEEGKHLTVSSIEVMDTSAYDSRENRGNNVTNNLDKNDRDSINIEDIINGCLHGE